MADTGAPWNLPYPLPTDLVRDGADAIKDLAEAVADGLDEAGSAGIGPNVVQSVLTDVLAESVGTGSISDDLTGLTATITPSSNTSKVLVLVSLNGTTASAPWQATLYRAGSPTGFIGDTAGSRRRVSAGAHSANERSPYALNIMYLDDPQVDTAITYSVRVGHQGAGTETVFINRGADNSDSSRNPRTASSITLIEVAA